MLNLFTRYTKSFSCGAPTVLGIQKANGCSCTRSTCCSAAKDDRISTTSIGDGGNELGMGKVREQVVNHVEHGEEIACVVPSDYLITAGVSNWGGYALAVGLRVLSSCPIHARYVRRGLAHFDEEKGVEEFVNTVEEEARILKMLADRGVRDGRTGKAEQSVDGFAFYPHHAEQIRNFQAVLDT